MRGGIGRSSCRPRSRGRRAATATTLPAAISPFRWTRAGRTPGTITLAIRRHRAPVGEAKDAIVALAGGPGQAAIPFAEQFARVLGPIAATRDLIVFDQRGIGLSEPLSCHRFELSARHARRVPAIAECAAQLGPTRSFYTTADTVADIEALRVAGGYEKLVLYGTSYGTKVAEDYAQAYPEPRRSAGARLGRAPERARTAQPRDVRGDPAHPAPAVRRARLRAHHPQPRRRSRASSCGAWRAERLRGRCDRRPRRRPHGAHLLRRPARNPDRGRSRTDPARRIPRGRALGGEWRHGRAGAPAGARRRRRSKRSGKPAARASTTPSTTRRAAKTSSFPWNRAAGPATRLAEAKARIGSAAREPARAVHARRTCSTSATCRHAPSGRTRHPRPRPVQAPLPSVPTLILSGADDLRTPTSNAREVAAQIPGSHLLVVPEHRALGAQLRPNALRERCPASPIRGQADQALRGHIATAAPAPDAAGTDGAWRDLAPARGNHGLPGRTLQAVVLTLGDFDRQLALRSSSSSNRADSEARCRCASAACARAGRDSRAQR